MSTLEKLITISKIKADDNQTRLLKELAVLEGISFKEIKEMSIERIDFIIQKYDYLYNPDYKVENINSFVLDGNKYSLPVSLFGKSYGLFESLEAITSNDSIGNNWEKLPYYLFLLTYKGDLFKDGEGIDLMEEESKKFLNISIKEALGLSSFFLTYGKGLLSDLRIYLETTMKSLQTKN